MCRRMVEMRMVFAAVSALALALGCGRGMSKEALAVSKEIPAATEMMKVYTEESLSFVTGICARIAAVPSAPERTALFRELEDAAFAVRFEDVEADAVREGCDERQVGMRLDRAYSMLKCLTEKIFFTEHVLRAPVSEQLEPCFRHFEKIQAENARRGITSDAASEGDLGFIEHWYHSCVSWGDLASPEEREAIQERFRRLAGREMRPKPEPPQDIGRSQR